MLLDKLDGGSWMMKDFIERMKLMFKELVEKNRNLIIAIFITAFIGILYLIIVLIILAVKGQIGDIPWYLYSQGKYIGYTIGIFIGLSLVRYVIHSFTNRKETIKPKPPNIVYYFPFLGLILYLFLVFGLPLGSIY